MKKLVVLLFVIGALVLAPAAFAQGNKGKGNEKSSPKAMEKKAAPAKTEGGIIDINTATADQLKTVAGIGDAYAAAIIKGRPYKRKDELVDKKLLPQGVYDKVKEKIVAKQK